jgi:hypothetical protein
MRGRNKYSGTLLAGVCGVGLLCASPTSAGTGGPGWAQRLGPNTPASLANTAYKQDLATAKHCEEHPEIMHTLLACRQAMARHPEMFVKPTSETSH